MVRRALLVAATAAAAAACGYRFTAGGGPLPGGARTLHVPVFRNATSEPGIEGFFTDAFRRELSRYGREGGEASDARVEGSITSVSSGAAIATIQRSDAGERLAVNMSSYRVQATVVLRVYKGSQKVGETTVSGGEDYVPGGSGDAFVLETEANRRTALRRLAQALMRQAYQNLTDF